MKKEITPEEALAILLKQRAASMDYYKRNREKIIEMHRAWRLANRDKLREYQKKRSAKVFAGYLAAKKAGLI